MQRLIGLLLAMVMLTSCGTKKEKPIVLSVDIWMGAAPIYYAQSQGWLDEANIKLLIASSITENLKNFTSKAADMVTGTNREYKVLKQTYPDLTSLIVYDRSYGGDIILSNRTLEQIKSSNTIKVYLERNTVGEEMWDYFVRYERISPKNFTLLSRYQEELAMMKSDPKGADEVIVTYNPHNLPLLEHGYHEIATSKDERYLIVDGVMSTRTFAFQHQEQIRHLRDAMVKALQVFRDDPKGFYEKVKAPLGNPSYEEFIQMSQNIEWTLPYPSQKIIEGLERSGYVTKDIIR